jgi:hypothetical protein
MHLWLRPEIQTLLRPKLNLQGPSAMGNADCNRLFAIKLGAAPGLRRRAENVHAPCTEQDISSKITRLFTRPESTLVLISNANITFFTHFKTQFQASSIPISAQPNVEISK